jgi:hypothetical protein
MAVQVFIAHPVILNPIKTWCISTSPNRVFFPVSVLLYGSMTTQCSIRVLARFRPVNKREQEEEARTGPNPAFVLQFPDEQTCKLADKTGGPYSFPLDRVFPPDTEQPVVYNDCGKPTIEFGVLRFFCS